MTIQKFEVGKWYRWTAGVISRPHQWNPDGEMDFILDGKPHKCVAISAPEEVQPFLNPDHAVAAFEDQPNPAGGDLYVWDWDSSREYFEEVPLPTVGTFRLVWQKFAKAIKRGKYEHPTK
jgi:hypothetical protein